MKRFLELDDYTSFPLSIKIHLFFCDKCKKEIFEIGEVLKGIRGICPFPIKRDISDQIMQSIKLIPLNNEKSISIINWLLAGMLLLGSTFLISFSNSLIWLKSCFGGNLEIPLNIILGIFISIYSSLFIGTHLDDLKRSIGFIKRNL